MAQFEEAGLRTYGIGHFMNSLKQFCNNTGASACVFAQINRSADAKSVPDKSDLSDSQAIEMASDNLIIIHRPEYNGEKVVWDPKAEQEISSENKMLVRVVKGRDYGIGDFVVESDMKYFRFHDTTHRHDFKYWELYEKKEFWMEHFGFGKIHVPEQVTVPF
jgi:replicative DNA helicase